MTLAEIEERLKEMREEEAPPNYYGKQLDLLLDFARFVAEGTELTKAKTVDGEAVAGHLIALQIQARALVKGIEG